VGSPLEVYKRRRWWPRCLRSEKGRSSFWVLAGVVGLWVCAPGIFDGVSGGVPFTSRYQREKRSRGRQFCESTGQSVVRIPVGGSSLAWTMTRKRNLGKRPGWPERTNRLMSSEVNVWHWNCAVSRLRRRREIQVRRKSGRAYHGHMNTQDSGGETGAQPTRIAAQNCAEFLIASWAGQLTGNFLTEERNSERKPNRLRLGVQPGSMDFPGKGRRRTFCGSAARRVWKMAAQKEVLRFPEQRQRDYAHLRSTE